MTADSKCAFIDLFTDEKDENGIPFVADANVFASHAWKYEDLSYLKPCLWCWLLRSICYVCHQLTRCLFLLITIRYDAFDVIDCMLEYDQEQEQAGNTSPRYFWFDTVVVCQWEQEGVAVRTQQWWAETFKKSIGEIGTTLLMLLPWHDPIPMTRAWCIWEVLSTLDTGANLHVRMPSSQMMDFCEQLTDHKNALVDTAFKTLESIDCRQASAWLEADRLMILNAVESSKDVYAEGGVKFSGFHGTNMAVKAQIRQWFINIAREAEETYFDDLEIADPLEQITKRAYLQFNVGTLLKKLGYIVEAEAKWLEALAECNQSVIGTSMYKALTKDIDVVGALHLQLGLSFKSQNKLDDALDQIEHAVEFYSTNVGKADDHPFRTTLGKAKVNEGLVRLARKETESAIICFEDGIAEYTRAGGGSTDFASPDMVDGWSNLAAAHQSLVRPGPKSERSDADSLHIEKAAEYFRKVEAGLTKLKLAKSLPAARLEQNVGLLEKSNENWEEAVKRCKKAVKLFEQIQGHNSMEVAAAIYSVGTCYYEKSLSVSDSKQVNSELKNAKRELNEAAKVVGVCANVPPNHPTQRAIENALVLVQKAIQ